MLVRVACSCVLTAGAVWLAPQAAAQDCAPGFERNPYTPECLAPVNTPTVNGVPCVPSNLGLCSSFLQNQQPARVPRTSIG
ncbi:MAG: hypothetical protein KDB47_14005 [Mycobacterium sp.]|nr:hypothetical protein [Mycobacterium sp.]